jgi:hypothetical protein
MQLEGITARARRHKQNHNCDVGDADDESTDGTTHTHADNQNITI